MRFAACSLLLVVLVFGPAVTAARADDVGKPMYTASATAKFMNFPGLPTCMRASVLSGDPSKGAFLLLVKTTTGCVVPWHWHSVTENLMFVSGQGKGAMKAPDGGAPVALRAGDYISLPGKGIHQFTCVMSCTFFLSADGAFDIHYVDASGAEIPPDQALKPKTKMPMKKDKQTDDMKGMKM
jgi:quercetin dioxygenase-like cupin family protein